LLDKTGSLLIDDRFYTILFEQGDHAVPPVPNTILGSPNFISLDLSTARQEYH
jgi:hypothetical protein